ncbi:hypothetical protein GIB67_025171 [Kingdonia uniflora]|uniref:VQ domain-containing protein n=1 Tax=Kingdonia uniflora TaxID=39325 RepID=A0A7J7N850_9MAGN|nr:hypothetical protein GIB67_025171 [Kingdonia uniflora]
MVMENKLSVVVHHQKKISPTSTQNTKSSPLSKKKKPIKVVYISNPMKVKTSASEFRAKVQELTGQDSDVAYSQSSEFSQGTESTDDIDELQAVPDEKVKTRNDDIEYLTQDVPRVVDEEEFYRRSWAFGSSNSPFDQFDDFSSQLLENFNCYNPSNLYSDTPTLVYDQNPLF